MTIASSLLHLFLAASLDGAVLPDLSTIRRQYEQTLSAFHTIDCEMKTTQNGIKNIPGEPPSPVFIHSNIHLWKRAERRSVQVEFIDYRQVISIEKNLRFNGSLYASWTVPRDLGDAPKWSPGGTMSSSKDNALFETFTIDRLIGSTLYAGDFPLQHLLAMPGVIVEKIDLIDEAPCLKVCIPRHVRSKKIPNLMNAETIAWFDPAVGCLPRLIRNRIFQSETDEHPQEYDFRTTRYEKIVGADGVRYVFPMAGRRTGSKIDESVEVVRIEINREIDLHQFEPKFPLGSEILVKIQGLAPQRIIIDK